MNYSNSKYWDCCAPIAGLLLTLSFAPFDYSCLAFVALVFLYTSWQNITAKRAALRGFLFGLGTFGSGVSWVYISMHDFGGAGVIESSLLTVLFASFWAVFPALAGYFSVKIIGLNKGRSQIVLIPLIWILIEYFRGYWLLNGFPWLQIAYSQLETPLAGYIPIIGVYGTGLIVALTASIITDIIFTATKTERSYSSCNSIQLGQLKHLLRHLFILAILWTIGGMLRHQTWTYEIGQVLSVSMVQGNISQDQKWKPENKITTLLKYKKMTEEHWASKVIIWPETAIPAFLDQVKDSFLTPLENEARLHNTDLIISVPVQETDPVKNYNAVITLGKDQSIYRKSHLLPFGEYQPLQPFSGFVLDLINIRLGDFTPGAANQPLLKAGGYPFITMICYEDAFGALGTKGLPEAAYLVNVTNDGWFGNTIEPHQHLQMARMRAMETGRYLLRSTNTGMTAIISPKGEILKLAPSFQEIVLTGTITPMGGMTPYGKLGDNPIIWGMIVFLLGLLLSSRDISIKHIKKNFNEILSNL